MRCVVAFLAIGHVAADPDYAPAVLRNNVIPLKMLVEVCNLRNEHDSRRMVDPAYRQAVAEAYVEALSSYFDGKNGKGNGRAS